MPTQSSLRWISDGNELKTALEGLGYTVDLQFAEDDIANQLSQIENMVTKGAKALVVGSIDGTTLSAVLQQAADAGIKVIAYDRLIRETPNVDLYTTFDNFQVGVLQANSLVQGLEERFPDDKPWNVELFGGSPDDNNAFFFYDGAMSVLQPMIDAGDIVIKSGQTGMEQVGTLRWDGAVAQARMDNILSANYSDGTRVHGVLAPYDGLSRGIISSLRGVGYGSADLAWPIITGQDAEAPSVKAIIAGEQYSTVYKDTRELAQRTAQLVDTLLTGGTPEGLDTTTYDNGVKVVPSVLLTPYSVDATNYQELVVDSGYIKAEDLQ
ncbi:sugar ABC transporter substrate-binding protein [Devosia chinhatensis]|uniref:Sugar ABC transporter substrate-binding protein n=2 Tax=Devosia TaxID=46913 RepID=A0A6M1SNQ7_9HYPH|nr:sugar ABC transporter substrate-binding protein [Devosia aurantiaca]